MNYTPEQISRLKYLLTDRWVTANRAETDQNLNALLDQIESAEELHQLAANFNRDCGSTVLQKVIIHPLCDKGTLLLIYYLGRPEFYYKILGQGKPFIGDMPQEFGFLKRIEGIIQSSEYRSNRIKVDPADLGPGHWNCLLKEGAESIPTFMKLPTEGESVEILNLWK